MGGMYAMIIFTRRHFVRRKTGEKREYFWNLKVSTKMQLCFSTVRGLLYMSMDIPDFISIFLKDFVMR